MYKKLKKKIAFLLLICMACSILPVTTSTAATKQETNKAITKGQVCTLVNELLGATKKSDDMKNIANYKEGDNYYSTLSIAYNAGYIAPDKNNKLFDANAKADYGFVATIFANILESTKSKILGSHKSKDTITEAQFKAFLKEVIPTTISKNLSNKTIKGNAVIKKPKLKLSNVTIKGSLIIGDGVADKEVTLNNVTVKGKLIVRGGGENSVIIMGDSNISTLVVNQVNHKVNIKVNGDAKVKLVYINDGCNDVILNGTFGSVNVTGNDINVSTGTAAISSITLSGENTSLDISENTTVQTVTLAEQASNAKVEISGKVMKVSSDAANSAITVGNTGTVSKITASKSATGTAIKVQDNATVEEVISTAEGLAVSGTGKVNKATVQGNNSEISTPNTQVVVGDGVTGVKNSTDSTAAPSTTPTSGGSSSGSGSSSNSGTTPSTPTNPDSGKYKTDARFATGYPKIEMSNNTSGPNTTVTLKLAEGVATPEKPATVYYIVSAINTHWDVTSTSVIHGHLGDDAAIRWDKTIEHQMINCDFTGALRISDSAEVSIPLHLYNSGEGMVAYFVIKTEDKTSEVPTKIEFTSDTVSSFADTYPPYIRSAYLSDATVASEGMLQRAVRVYVNEKLDQTQAVTGSSLTVTGGAFTVSNVPGGMITDVSINYNSAYSYYANFIDLTLTYPASSDLSQLVIDYTKPAQGGLTDTANIPNQMDSFTLERTLTSDFYGHYAIFDPTPTIKKLNVSNDGKYLCVEFSPRTMYDDYKVKVDGVEWDIYLINYSDTYCRLYLNNNNAVSKKDSYQIEVLNSNGGRIKNMLEEEVELAATISNPTVPSLTATSATLNLTNKTLSLTYTGDTAGARDIYTSCQYVISLNDANGLTYQFRGEASQSYNGRPNEMTIVFDKEDMFEVDFSKITTASNITLSYIKQGIVRTSGFSDASGRPIDEFTLNVQVVE